MNELDISENNFKCIPKLENTSNIKLDLTVNPLEKQNRYNIAQWLDLTHRDIVINVDYDDTKCVALNLSNLKVIQIPETLCKFYLSYSPFNILDLSNNQIKAIPDFFSAFDALHTLHLKNNQLTHIPEILLGLNHLQKLTLLGNPICFEELKNRQIFEELRKKGVNIDIILPKLSPPPPQEILPLDLKTNQSPSPEKTTESTPLLRVNPTPPNNPPEKNTTKITITDPALRTALEKFMKSNYGTLILQL